MNRLGCLLALATASIVLAACNLFSNGSSTNNVGLVVSTGQLSNSGGGSYTYNAGSIPQYSTEAVVFIFSNSGSSPFTSSGTISFTNSDFSASNLSSFTIPAGGTATLNASFTPSTVATETGTLTLGGSNGANLVVTLQGTGDSNCMVQETIPSGVAFTPGQPFRITGSPANFQLAGGSSSISLTGGPNYVVTSPNPFFSASMAGSATAFGGSLSSPTNFTLIDSSTNATGDLATVTFSGIDGATGASFTFTFQVQDEFTS